MKTLPSKSPVSERIIDPEDPAIHFLETMSYADREKLITALLKRFLPEKLPAQTVPLPTPLRPLAGGRR
jgi:hypothetical protein